MVEKAGKQIELSIHGTTVGGIILLMLYSVTLTPTMAGPIIFWAAGIGVGLILLPILWHTHRWIPAKMHIMAAFLGEEELKEGETITAAQALKTAIQFPVESPLIGIVLWLLGGLGALFGALIAMEFKPLVFDMAITYLGIVFAALLINIFQFYLSSRILDPVVSAIIKKEPSVLDEELQISRRPLGTTFLMTMVPLIIVSLTVAGLAGYRKAETTLQLWVGQAHMSEIEDCYAKIEGLDLTNEQEFNKAKQILIKENIPGDREVMLISHDLDDKDDKSWRTDLLFAKEHGYPAVIFDVIERAIGDTPDKPATTFNPYGPTVQLFKQFDFENNDSKQRYYLVFGYPWEKFSHNLSGLILVTVILICITILITSGVAYIASKDITVPIQRLAEFTEAISRGEIREDVFYNANDEVGDLAISMKKMGQSLKEIVENLFKTAENLDLATEAIEEAAVSVDDGSQHEEIAVENVLTSMMEMNMTIQGIAGNVEVLSGSTEESSSSIFQMTASIARITENVDVLNEAVSNTSTSITQMSSALNQVADNVINLSALSEETASSMAEMDSTIREIENHSKETASWSEGVTKEAEEGEISVRKSSDGMRAIAEVVSGVQGVINRLGERTEEIGKIVQVIDEVANQTNLLALNAAIIAAQAGEHGRGFAVVADEIKDLAERTAGSTRDIRQLITSVQEEIQEAVSEVDKGTKSAKEGIRLSDQAINSFVEILGNTRQATERVKNIARSTLEQTNASRQVSTAIDQVADMINQISVATQQQSKGGSQIIMSVEEMKDVALQVKRNTDEQLQGSRLINKSIENISDMLQNINSAQQEQKKGSTQVVHMVEQIKAISQQGVENSSKLASVVKKLKDQSTILRSQVGRFTVSS